jgi:hypothetical protein
MLVNVSPDMGMYHLLRSQGYDPAYAIAEFIDNALQAHLLSQAKEDAHTRPLKVTLKFYSAHYTKTAQRNSLVIEDDGPGLQRARLRDAMKPAKPSPVKGLSEFGIGMKAAAVWFSDSWTLSTRPHGTKGRFKLTFDLPLLMASGASTIEVVDEKQPGAEGTTITLHQLRRPIDRNQFQIICKDLCELYQRFTAGTSPAMELEARYDDTPQPLRFEETDKTVLVRPVFKQVDKNFYAIGKDVTWQVTVDMVFQGSTITGMVCLLERGSYVDNPGVIMFRGNRVIRGTSRNPNLPQALFQTSNKYARQRVYGQLFVDGLPVTYTKDGFEIDEDAFARQLRTVDGMEALLKQAEAYRANKEFTVVVKESDIPGLKGTKPAEKPGGKADTTTKPDGKPTNKQGKRPKKPEPPPALLKLLYDMATGTPSLALKSIIEETITQYKYRREYGTALCLRVVVEVATMDYIRRKLPAQYAKVSEKAIKSLLNYMNSNPADFFDMKAEYTVSKCVQSLANGSQPDVVLLNNAAHGHYQPNFAELNRFATNLEPLMRWAMRA